MRDRLRITNAQKIGFLNRFLVTYGPAVAGGTPFIVGASLLLNFLASLNFSITVPVAVDAATSPANYPLGHQFNLTGTTAPGEVYVIANTGVTDAVMANYACPRTLS